MTTVTDLFCGAGGSSSGMASRGATIRMAANHWKLAVESHNANFPDTDHDTADISQVDPRRYPRTDILWGSPECFPAGTLILTLYAGWKPIETVQVGDEVLTHKGRWQKVTRTQSRQGSTVVVRGQGHTPGIEVTPTHRFWLRSSAQAWSREAGQMRRAHDEPAFAPVGEAMAAQAFWATPADRAATTNPAMPYMPTPAVFGRGPNAWWLIGRWLADGSLTFGKGRHDVVITCAFEEESEVGQHLEQTGQLWRYRTMRTAGAWSIPDEPARDWLRAEFGHGSANKHMPGWVLCLNEVSRTALLEGYVSGDGHVSDRRTRTDSVSKKLALSVRLLAESLGHRTGLYRYPQHSHRIEGRDIAGQDLWAVAWETKGSEREAFWSPVDNQSWSRIRSVEPGREHVEVYNLEVDEDHSYVAEGIVVANCTNHSQAKGKKRITGQQYLDEPPLPDEAAERSRATMWDVVRFAEHHRYDVVLVENVVDAAKWELFDAWWLALTSLGYCAHTVWLNSMHAGDLTSGGVVPAPQSRDRMYVVAHRRQLRCPDLTVRPPAWCAHCDRVVEARQSWKRPDRKAWGRYRAQYTYVCSTAGCWKPVEPYVLPAAAAIDWALAGDRIGDRARPLADKTRARIAAGLHRYARPVHLEAGGNQYDAADPKHRQHGTADGYMRAWPADTEPLRTLHTALTKAVAVAPGMLVPAGGTWNDHAMSAAEPMRTRTSRDTEALVTGPLLIPVEGRVGKTATAVAEPMRTQTARNETGLLVPPLVSALRTHAKARPVGDDPLMTVCAGTQHQFLVEPPALVMRNNEGGAEMSTPVREPLRTLTTAGHQSLITWAALYAHDSGVRDLHRPLPTQTTVQGDAVLTLDQATDLVDDCLFRMLEPHEIQAGMAFDPGYGVLGNKREQVRQLGNAVTPPAAAWLYERVLPILDGTAA